MKTLQQLYDNPFAYARSMMNGMDDRQGSILMDAIVGQWEQIKNLTPAEARKYMEEGR